MKKEEKHQCLFLFYTRTIDRKNKNKPEKPMGLANGPMG